MKKILLYFLLIFFKQLCYSQTYYQVPMSLGPHAIGGITVTTVQLTPALSGGTACFTSGVDINDTQSVRFKFSSPVSSIRSDMIDYQSGDSVSIKINGSYYYVNNYNLSWFSVSWGVPFCVISNANTVIAAGGKITAATNSNSGGGTQLDIHFAAGIDSIDFYQNSSANLIQLNLYFANSCFGNAAASSDSPCVGGTLHLYGSTANLSSGTNGFSDTVQNPVINNADTNATGLYKYTVVDDTCTYYGYVNVVVTPYPILNVSSNTPICTGDSLLFNISNSQSGVTYAWNGPNSFSSTLQSPKKYNIQFADSGDYRVIGNLRGCKDTALTHVSVRQKPAKPVASNNGPLCSYHALNLGATCATSGVNYNWSGPSYSSTQQNPNINSALASNAGTYIVTANLNGCTAKDTTNVIITQGPDSVYAYLSIPLCTTDTLHLYAGSITAGVSFSWSGPSYSSSNANSTISNVALSNAGTYYLTASLGSCVVHDTLQLTVNQKPAAATVNSNSPVCEGSSLSLTSSSTTPGVSYSWTGPNSYSVNGQNPTRTNIVMTDSGFYFAKVTLGACSTVSAVYVMTKPRPQAVTITNNSPVCAGDTLELGIGNLGLGTSYQWTGPAGFSVNADSVQRPNAQSSFTGNYVLTSTLNGCARYDTVNAVVKPLPALPNITSNSAVCAGDSLGLSISNWQTNVSYNWSGPAGFSDTGHQSKRLNMTMGYAGYYKVLATLNGCSIKDSANVQVNPLPNIPLASSNSPVCVGDTLKLIVGNPQSGASYSWTGPASFGASIANPIRVNAQVSYAGTYTATANLNGCTASGNTMVMVNPQVGPPTISISVSPGDTVCAGTNLTFTASVTNAGGPVYTWLKNGGSLGAGNTAAITTASVSNGDHTSCKVTSNTPC